MSWLGQVGSCRGPDDVLMWMRLASTELVALVVLVSDADVAW